MSTLKIISLLLITLGAGTMLFGFIKYFEIVTYANDLFKNSKSTIKHWYRVYHAMMLFFCLSYTAVFVFLFLDIRFIGDLFTGIIFLFGALFVILGILLQSRIMQALSRQHGELETTNRQLNQIQEATIYSLAYLAEIRDIETGKHIERTSAYVKLLAEELQKLPKYRDHLTPRYIEDLVKAAPLHDIGKVGVPDEILKKPGKLTDAEFHLIKKHSRYGADVLTNAAQDLNFESYFSLAIPVVLSHHERWDGSGYPDGLHGDQIPLSAQLMSVADVYDALRSKRCYKDGFSHEKALAIMQKERGLQFAPDVIDAFLKVNETFKSISEKMAD